MDNIGKYSVRELQEMQEYCVYICKVVPYLPGSYVKEIHEIALVEINRVLDERKNRKEINK